METIDIIDLRSNALIHLVNLKGIYKVSYDVLSKWSEVVASEFYKENKDIPIYHCIERDRTNFLKNKYKEYFNFMDEDRYIELKDDVDYNEMRRYFHSGISLNLLLAFVSETSINSLLSLVEEEEKNG